MTRELGESMSFCSIMFCIPVHTAFVTRIQGDTCGTNGGHQPGPE